MKPADAFVNEPSVIRARLLARVRALGPDGISEEWLRAHGDEVYHDWPRAVEELVSLGLIARRVISRPRSGRKWHEPRTGVVYVAVRDERGEYPR